MASKITASFIIIGNEILSGRTKDENLNFLATELTNIGVSLEEVRVVRDIEDDIIFAVNEVRKKYNYVFTSGGIGPTHDDITALAIAKAFNVKLILDPEAEGLLKEHYPQEKLNDARLKMAYIPEGSLLLNNPVSSAPGFKKENVFVMAGVPNIMQSMFFASKEHLANGAKTYSNSINVIVGEGDIAASLGKVQDKYNEVEIGSYPFIKNGRVGTSLVFRSTNKKIADQANKDMLEIIKEMNIPLID